jgi:hypothetical protein
MDGTVLFRKISNGLLNNEHGRKEEDVTSSRHLELGGGGVF